MIGPDMLNRRITKDMKRPQCLHCRRAIKPGQVGIFQNLGNQHPITDRQIWWHATCVQGAIDDCPPDQDEQAFNSLRDRIAAAGVAFPD